MEINANIYIITDSQELMEKTEAILSRETDAFFVTAQCPPRIKSKKARRQLRRKECRLRG